MFLSIISVKSTPALTDAVRLSSMSYDNLTLPKAFISFSEFELSSDSLSVRKAVLAKPAVPSPSRLNDPSSLKGSKYGLAIYGAKNGLSKFPENSLGISLDLLKFAERLTDAVNRSAF